jgi:hypothetical protein
MSRSLGLREDQRWGEILVTRIVQLLPVEPRWCHRGIGIYTSPDPGL